MYIFAPVNFQGTFSRSFNLVTSLAFMKQNSPAHMEGMRLLKALLAAQKTLDIADKLIDNLRQDSSIRVKE
jgi:hypothetical protein